MADPRGALRIHPRFGIISFVFMKFSAKMLPNNRLAPPENPGSTTEKFLCRVKPTMFTGRLPSTMQHRRTPVGACLIIIDDRKSLAGIDPT